MEVSKVHRLDKFPVCVLTYRVNLIMFIMFNKCEPKITKVLTVIALVMVLVSCSKPISVNQRVGDGEIVDQFCKPPYSTTTMISTGKVTIPTVQTYPAIYRTTIKVSDYPYTIEYNGSALYSKEIGTKVKVEWVEKVYKQRDGTFKIVTSDVEVTGVYGRRIN